MEPNSEGIAKTVMIIEALAVAMTLTLTHNDAITTPWLIVIG